jgi:uracil phosphoribosyltransferase
MPKFIIEVRSKGFDKATRDFNRVKESAKGYEKAVGNARGTTSGFRRQLGALRNNLLLLTFAFVGVSKGIGGFVRAASQFESVKTRLVGLTGSVQNAERAFAAFNEIAATTPFELNDVVQAGATLEAFGVKAEVIVPAITDLAAHMGMTMPEAASAFGRAFAGGVGAADIFREKGVLQVISDTQKIDDLTKLTLPQFRQELIRTLINPTAGIAGSSKRMADTWEGAVSNMRDSITRFQALVGDAMLPTLKKMVKATEQFFRSIDLQTLAQFATSVGVATTALALYQARAIGAAVVTAAMTLNWKKFIGAVVLGGLAFAVDELLQMTDAFSGLSKQVNANTSAQKNQNLATKQYIKQLGQTTSAIGVTAEARQRLNAIMMDTVLLTMQNNGVDEKRIMITQAIFRAEQSLSEELRDVVTINRDLATQGIFAFNLSQTATEQQRLEANAIRRKTEAQIESIMTGKQVISTNSRIASSFNSVANAIGVLKDETQDSKQQFLAIIRILGGLASSFGPQGAMFGGALNIGAAMFGHTGGLVKNNGIQRFATGGMVGGQDNVPIMAQAGEFVMRREAVQNIGVQNLAQMNRSGSAGRSVTINIHGGVVQDDYVRNELIPAINKAVSTGSVINA